MSVTLMDDMSLVGCLAYLITFIVIGIVILPVVMCCILMCCT
jgi:hypothetical protein